MPQDAFTLRRVAKELASSLIGGKLTKIIQPDKDSVLFYLYTEKGAVKLILSTNASNARISLTSAEYGAPASAPNFCMLTGPPAVMLAAATNSITADNAGRNKNVFMAVKVLW